MRQMYMMVAVLAMVAMFGAPALGQERERGERRGFNPENLTPEQRERFEQFRQQREQRGDRQRGDRERGDRERGDRERGEGRRGGREAFDREALEERRAAMQRRQEEQLRTQLDMTSEEFEVVQPIFRRVTTLQGQLMSRGIGGAEGAYGEAVQGLRAVIQDEDAGEEQINAALAAVREARAQVEGDLTAAQEELRELLTLRQEATLVAMGLIPPGEAPEAG